jgi:hypothetical protein
VNQPQRPFGRAIRYAVLPIEAVRINRIRTEDEVIEAQKGVTDDMIKALEEMVNAAKAGKLEGRAALALGAAKW